MKFTFDKGSESLILLVFIQDSSSSIGAGLGSLDQTSGIVGFFNRMGGLGIALAVDENVTTEGTYQAPSAVGKVRIGTPANARTGYYELHFHSDLFALGAEAVSIGLGGATNMAELPLEIQLDDLVRLNATAQGKLEDQYDGTGYTADTAPATQAQLDGIANVGSASHKQITGEVLTTPATTTGGSFTDIQQLNGVYMYWDAVSGGFEAEFTTNIGSGTPGRVNINGYLQGNNDAIRVQMWDYQAGTPGWKTIGPWKGGNLSNNKEVPFTAFIGYVGIGANKGDIRIRIYNDNGTDDVALTAANIYIDQMSLEFSPSASSTLDRIYFDSNASNTNTVPGQDGVPGNPVSTLVAVNTLLAATGLHRVEVAPASTATLDAAQSNQVFSGENWILELEAQNIAGSAFIGADVSGIAGGTGTKQTFRECHMDAVTLIKGTHVLECGIGGTQTAGEAGDYHYGRCRSSIAGVATWIFDFSTVGDTNLNWRNGSGGIQLENMGNVGTDTASIEGRGQIIEGTCTGGIVAVRGLFTTSGITNLELVDDARFSRAQVATDTVDEWEVQSQANPSGFHVNLMEIDSNANIMKKFKEYVDANVLFSDTAQAGGASEITLALGTSLKDNDLKDFAIYLNGGTGVGEFARIESVIAATQVAVIKTPVNGWATIPDGTTTYVILSAGSIQHISSLHAAALTEITTELDDNSTFANEVTTILADTNALQTDWTNGGRLDLIIDATLADTHELQTDWTNGGRLDLIIDSTLADTSELQTDWTDDGRLDVIVDSILDYVGTSGVVVAAASKAGYELSAGGVAAILDEVVEGTLTMRQLLRIVLSASAGISDGGGTANLSFQDLADLKARITATVDANGNRTAVTRDGT